MFSNGVRTLWTVVFVLACLSSRPHLAEGWSWNPFASKSESKDSSPLYSKSSSGNKSWLPEWKAPKMPWSSKDKPTSYAKKNDSAWKKMSKTSKQWWDKTADILDPYPEPKPATPAYAKPKKPSMFASWFKKEEPKKIESVNDFLKQERID